MNWELLKARQQNEFEPLFEEDISTEQRQLLLEDSELLYKNLIWRAKFNLDKREGDIGYLGYATDNYETADITLPNMTDVFVWINLEGDGQLQITQGVGEEYCTEKGDWALGISRLSAHPAYRKHEYTVALWGQGYIEIKSELIREDGSFESVIPLKEDFKILGEALNEACIILLSQTK